MLFVQVDVGNFWFVKQTRNKALKFSTCFLFVLSFPYPEEKGTKFNSPSQSPAQPAEPLKCLAHMYPFGSSSYLCMMMGLLSSHKLIKWIHFPLPTAPKSTLDVVDRFIFPKKKKKKKGIPDII